MLQIKLLPLCVGFISLLAQACSSEGYQGSADCIATPEYVAGSSASYLLERSDGTSEEFTVTVSSNSEQERIATFVIEGEAGAYTVTDNYACDDSSSSSQASVSDLEDDQLARALLTTDVDRFDEKDVTRAPAGSGNPAPLRDPDERYPCQVDEGSDEVELFSSREIVRCTSTMASGTHDMRTTFVVEVSSSKPFPAAGVIFKERSREYGETDSVRLLDWNGL